MINPQLEHKVVLITGANHGIGSASARAFAKQGAKVFIAYFREPCEYSEEELTMAVEAGVGGDKYFRAKQQQTADPVVEDIRSKGGISCAYEADLANTENIPKLFDVCEKELGPVDILVNNHTYDVLETFDPELASDNYQWFNEYSVQLISKTTIDASFAVNTRAYALLMLEYLRRYLHRGAKWGRIINLSTDAAHAHVANVSYAASKHAIESYSRSAAAELGKYGITVNIVAPGPIQTGYMTLDMEKTLTEQAPLGRVGYPEDVADVIVFLASEQAHWLTGQLLYVGGGWQMHQ
ncbi:SDR family NAD(P)-dependent oxidoreductase [Candidatus Neomarinimicrobiota bacterium]